MVDCGSGMSVGCTAGPIGFNNSRSIGNITNFSGHHHTVKRPEQFENGSIGDYGCQCGGDELMSPIF